MTDIYTSIKADHDKTRGLMDEIAGTSAGQADRRAELFDRFKRNLWAHNKVEEAVFYAELLSTRETRDDTMEAMSEHHSANALIEDLDLMEKGDAAWLPKFTHLKELLEHHMQEEEKDLFAEARDVLDRDRAEKLGDAFEDRKEAVGSALKRVSH